MFLVWAVGVAKVVVRFEGVDDACDPSAPRAATPGVMQA